MESPLSSRLYEAVNEVLAAYVDTDVIYVHGEDGQPIAALIPIEVWRREMAADTIYVPSPFETYSHDHIQVGEDRG